MMGRHKRLRGLHKARPTPHKADRPKRGRRAGTGALALVLGVGALVPAAAYTVQRGDTLWEIARENDTTVRRLVRLNRRIDDPDRIFVGQRIRVRGKVLRLRRSVDGRGYRVSRDTRRPTLNAGPIPAAGSWDFHAGYGNPAVDINVAGSADCGNTVRSAVGGVVDHVFWGYGDEHGRYGNHVIVDGTLYAHLSDIDTHVGEWVSRGEPIGNVGSSGNSTGCHLHYEWGR